MASCNSVEDHPEDKREARRKQVMLGELPSDFLRVTPVTTDQQLALDEQAALALQQQLSGNTTASTVAGRLTISILEAKLNKNYGITRMDPYVRLRIGPTVYETNSDYNGARNPRWNKSFNCYLLPQDTCIDIEIYDECAFSLDEKIAWASYDIPESVLQGETVNVWIELSGKLGKGKEGLINLVITCQPVPSGTLVCQLQPMVGVMPYGSVYARDAAPYPKCVPPKCHQNVMAVSNPVPAAVQEIPEQISKEDLKQVIEMFPNIEEDVVQTVMDSNRGNKDETINALLALSEGT